jgi:hypothetical protein
MEFGRGRGNNTLHTEKILERLMTDYFFDTKSRITIFRAVNLTARTILPKSKFPKCGFSQLMAHFKQIKFANNLQMGNKIHPLWRNLARNWPLRDAYKLFFSMIV